MKSLQTFVAVLVLSCMWANASPAQDWPQWRGPNRDSTVPGFVVPQQWPTELTKKWSTEVGSGDSGPLLIGDKIYVFARQDADETTYCLNAKTGEIVWQEKYPADVVTGPPGSHPGPRSTSAAADGKLCTLGVGGVLSCLDANSGKVLWRKDSKDFAKQWPQAFTSMSPVIADGKCIAHLGGTGAGALVAYDLATGNERWRASSDGPAYGSPVLATIDGVKQVINVTEKNAIGVALTDGKLLWEEPFRAMQNTTTPVVDGNTIFISAQGRGTVALRIAKQGDEFKVEQVWNRPTPSPRYTTPVLKDGLLYGATSTGNLYCLNAKTGEAAWTDTARRADPASILDVGPVLLALTANSNLTIFAPSGAEFKELASLKLSGSPVWSYPAISGNRLFVKDKDTVTLWTIE